jgi:predicted permease
MGANTTIFSVVNALLIRPLPVEEPERLVSVFTTYVGGDRYGITSYPDYEDLRDRNDVFTDLAAETYAPIGLGGTDRSEVVLGQVVTWNYFSVLGVQAVLGRTFLPEEDRVAGSHPVALLSHRIWQRLFESDPLITGQTVQINGLPFTVVGVAPEGFTGTSVILAPDVWVPVMMAAHALTYSPQLDGRADPFLHLIGRMKPGVPRARAQTAVRRVGAVLEQEYPGSNSGKSFTLVAAGKNRFGSGTTDDVARFMTVMMGVVGLVLLIACFNVANLSLAKATGRQREIALRHSLGASRWRITRQLLTESMLLSVVAGAAGLLFALWMSDLLVAVRPPIPLPLEIDLFPDRRVLAFTGLLALVTGVLFGLAPAVQTLRPGQFAALRDQAHVLSHGRSTSRLRSSLVALQLALSLVLLVSAGLFVRSLRNILTVDPGFDLRSGLILPVNLGFGQYDDNEGRLFVQQLVDRVESMPGVHSTALAAFLPLGVVHGHHDVVIDGYEPRTDESMLVKRNIVGPGYFETMGIPVVSGRGIGERDLENTEPVAVINETMARRYWPGERALGRTIRADRGIPRLVVGVIKDGKYDTLDEVPQPYLVLPLRQVELTRRVNLVVRTAGDPRPMMEQVLAEARRLDPNLPFENIATLPQYLELSLGSVKAPAMLVGAFGLLAMVLAVVGVYGVTSYTVSQRLHEFGVRMALGAQRRVIVSMVVRRTLPTTVIGVAAGLALAFGVTRVLSALFYGMSTVEPVIYAAVAAGLLAVAQLACYIPARSAGKVSPTVTLRTQ